LNALFEQKHVWRPPQLTRLSPSIFGSLAQIFTFSTFSPLYYFFHYVFSPIESFRGLDLRLTNARFTRGVLPAMALGYYAPLLLKYFGYEGSSEMATKIWQFFPVSVAVIQHLLARTVFPDTIEHDRIHYVKRDLPAIRMTMGIFITISTALWWYALSHAPVSLADMFASTSINRSLISVESLRYILQTDQVLSFGGALIWLAYLFWDLKAAGMVEQSWLSLLVRTSLTTVAAGPGVTIGAGWLWREETLASKFHKSAVTKANKLGEPVLNGAATNGVAKAANGHAKH
jgi:hypothetical protein